MAQYANVLFKSGGADLHMAVFPIPGRSVSLSPLSFPVRSAPISRLLLLLQNLLGASGMIKKSVHYTILSKTNLNLGEREGQEAGWSMSPGSG